MLGRRIALLLLLLLLSLSREEGLRLVDRSWSSRDRCLSEGALSALLR